MEPSYVGETHGCPFLGIDTDVVYACYRNEVCCEGGCCTKPFITTFRMCYIWIAIIAIVFACTGGLKYCKAGSQRTERERFLARRARISSRNSNRDDQIPPIHCDIPNLELYLQNTPPRLSNLEERVSLRNLLGTTEACHVAIDRYIACRNARTRESLRSTSPPPYHSIGSKQTTCDPYDPPPHYSTVCNAAPVQYRQTSNEATPTTVSADVHTTFSTNSNVVLVPGIHREGEEGEQR